MVRLTFSQAIDGFTLEKQAKRLSNRTLNDYRRSFDKFQDFLGEDPPIADITADHIRAFMIHIGTTPRAPGGVAPRPERILSKKSQLNIHATLSSLWSWAVAAGFADQHVVRGVPRPQAEQRAILPFTEDDVRAILDGCDHTASYTRPGKRACANRRPTARRTRSAMVTPAASASSDSFEYR